MLVPPGIGSPRWIHYAPGRPLVPKSACLANLVERFYRGAAMGRLTGKRALVTGAGGLLGSDLARAFAAEGADLVLTTRTVAKLEPLAGEIRALGVRAATIAADFTSDADADRLAAEAWDAFGGVDIVL